MESRHWKWRWFSHEFGFTWEPNIRAKGWHRWLNREDDGDVYRHWGYGPLLLVWNTAGPAALKYEPCPKWPERVRRYGEADYEDDTPDAEPAYRALMRVR